MEEGDGRVTHLRQPRHHRLELLGDNKRAHVLFGRVVWEDSRDVAEHHVAHGLEVRGR